MEEYELGKRRVGTGFGREPGVAADGGFLAGDGLLSLREGMRPGREDAGD